MTQIGHLVFLNKVIIPVSSINLIDFHVERKKYKVNCIRLKIRLGPLTDPVISERPDSGFFAKVGSGSSYSRGFDPGSVTLNLNYIFSTSPPR